MHTRPRCEKKLADAARRAGAVVYLPLQSKTHHYGARERTFSSPLFAGYVFCRGDIALRQWLRQNQHTANLLEVVDQAALAAQLQQLHALLAAGSLVEVMPFLESGRRVRVKSGPLRGLEGIVVRVHGTARVVVNIDMIRQAAAVEVDSATLAPV
ncbi:MAG TPA: hypothetical protein PKE12_00650 [Kiritimatiellia bacterium]|nr:hypothetical protein [Kiritimatiellia bacterium]